MSDRYRVRITANAALHVDLTLHPALTCEQDPKIPLPEAGYHPPILHPILFQLRSMVSDFQELIFISTASHLQTAPMTVGDLWTF